MNSRYGDTGEAVCRLTSAAAWCSASCAACLGSTVLSSQPGLRLALLSGRLRWLRPAWVDKAAHTTEPVSAIRKGRLNVSFAHQQSLHVHQHDALVD